MHTAFDAEEAADIIDDLKALEGPLLPILNEFQSRFGFVGDDAVRMISAALNLTRAEVYGVVSFYHDYKKAPHGAQVLKLCRAEACQASGGDALAVSIEKALGMKFGETSADGRVTLEAVYCLGLCATAPSAMLDGRLVGRLNRKSVERIIGELRP